MGESRRKKVRKGERGRKKGKKKEREEGIREVRRKK